jgi:predicted unusual protein kinase regulating ubiquinone biosynthesis (AarF/ABC1/UbiB family)
MEDHGRRASGADWIERLRDLRRLLGWSQRKLARELRVTPGAVSQWESGRRAIPGPVKRLVEIYEERLGMIDPPADKGLEKINGSWVSRTLRSSTTAARVASRLAGSSLRSLVVSNARANEIKRATEIAMARELSESLGELKGLLMKVGQMASYVDFAAPEHVRDVLKKLQDDARPMSADAIDSVFLESMGDTPDRIFARFWRRPFAAASIGQVHEAMLADGTRVAVKVQYPGIRRVLESDLRNLDALERLARSYFPALDSRALLDELGDRLLEECDYVHEAESQEAFRRAFAGTPRVVIPRVHSDLSTERILTTDYVDGQRFDAFARTADQASRDGAGEVIFRVVWGGIFRHGILNADPHPGNYLFLPNGGVAFLDFGCVKRFPPRLLRRWRAFALAVTEGRRTEADRLAIELGFVADADRFDFDGHYEMIRGIYEPWISDGAFRFNPHFVERNWRVMMVENPNKTQMRLPPDLLFAQRNLLGLYSVLAALEARGDWRAIWAEVVAADRSA